MVRGFLEQEADAFQARPSEVGYSLIELLVVVMILGILAAMGAFKYFKTVEISRANEASRLMQQIGAANYMFMKAATLANGGGTYVSGAITNALNPNNASPVCDYTLANPGPVQLFSCNVLVGREWNSLLYNFYALNPTNDFLDAQCAGGSGAVFPHQNNFTACAARKNVPNPGAPYDGWGYAIDISGNIVPYGGAPEAQ